MVKLTICHSFDIRVSNSETGEMAQPIKALATKPENWSWILGTHLVFRRRE